MLFMTQNHKLRVFLVAALAASSSAFAPPSSSVRRQPRQRRSRIHEWPLRYLDTDEHSLHRELDALGSSSCSVASSVSACNQVQWSTLTALDAEMDTFASPNDKRYSAADWLHNINNFHNSSILKQIRGPVQAITIWSTLVSVVYKLCKIKGWNGVAEKMCLGSTPHSLIASSIGLLLVFRTNSAYQKFRVS